MPTQLPADIVFTGGPVHVGDAARTRTRAVAVTGERIVAVGRAAGELIGRGTEVVDLRGRLLIPGFQDAHVHPVGAGVEMGLCDLTGATTIEEIHDRIGRYAAAHPSAPWITGGGWSMETFPGGVPGRELLDALLPDRPAYLVNRDHHGAWVNSRAMELAGIDAGTPDPRDGRIERGADGHPSGTLQEGAMDLVARLVPAPTEAELLAGLLRAQELLHSLGITAWQDAIVGENPIMPDVTGAYRAAVGQGLLTARVVAALWWRRDRGAEQIDDLLAARESLTAGGLRATSVKIMQDGVAENHTAAMLAPYLGGCGCTSPGDHRGTSFVDPEALREYVARLDRLGFQVHFHALGDRAVREALDAVAAARSANGFSDTRPHLAHLQVVHPEDVPRFRELGATANIQPLWAAHEPQMDELTIPFLGPERSARQYPFADLLHAGATLAGGSDWPVSSPDPIQGIHVAVNRIEPGHDAPAFYPEQRVDLGSALAAYTAGSAYVNHLDDTGTIAVGDLADLAVLDRDPFAGPAAACAAALADARPVSFWLDRAERPEPRPVLNGDLRCDLAIVGGGYSGLWTALLAKEADPARDVVLIEGARIGWAASGRNGGFCDASLTHGEANGRARWPEGYDELDRLGRRNLDGIEATLARHRIDCDFRRTGQLTVATEAHQVAELRASTGGDFLDAAAVRREVDSPTFLAGRWERETCALVDPALLAWGLAAAAERLGVRIVEDTPVRGLGDDDGGGMALHTERGTVRADRVALGTNAFRPLLRRLQLSTVPVYDYVLMTEPLSGAQLAAIGWRNRQGVGDSGNRFHYYRLTADNRILWGGYDAIYHFGRRLRTSYDQRPTTFATLAEQFFTTFPQLEGLRFTHRWGGAIDTCTRFCAFYGTAYRGRVAYALGYTGLGVGATRFGAQVMLDLLAGEETGRTRLELVRTRPLPFPPEPLAYAGIQATRWSLAHADQHAGHRNLWLRTLDRLGLGFDS